MLNESQDCAGGGGGSTLPRSPKLPRLQNSEAFFPVFRRLQRITAVATVHLDLLGLDVSCLQVRPYVDSTAGRTGRRGVSPRTVPTNPIQGRKTLVCALLPCADDSRPSWSDFFEASTPAAAGRDAGRWPRRWPRRQPGRRTPIRSPSRPHRTHKHSLTLTV